MQPRSPLPRPVWQLGWVSFCTDVANEAIYPLLPTFLVHTLGASTFSLGLIEGVADAASSLLKLASGHVSDRWGRRRPLVLLGYGLASAARPLTSIVTGWTGLLAVRFTDRLGKGLRGAPRDAMLAHFAPPGELGRVFGFHRAMDHSGAILGPVLASLFLLAFPGKYRLLFALTVVPGAIAMLLLSRIADAPVPVPVQPKATTPRPRLPPSLYRTLAVLTVFALGNSTDAFLLLRLTDLGIAPAWLPLLWAGLHVVKATTSTLGGAASDRFGRRTLIGAGWLLYAAVYGCFGLTQSSTMAIGAFLAYGLVFGLIEGPEKALVAEMATPELRGTAFGLYNAAAGIGLLLASLLFGWAWTTFDATTAFLMGAALALLATILLPLTRDGGGDPRPHLR